MQSWVVHFTKNWTGQLPIRACDFSGFRTRKKWSIEFVKIIVTQNFKPLSSAVCIPLRHWHVQTLFTSVSSFQDFWSAKFFCTIITLNRGISWVHLLWLGFLDVICLLCRECSNKKLSPIWLTALLCTQKCLSLSGCLSVYRSPFIHPLIHLFDSTLVHTK